MRRSILVLCALVVGLTTATSAWAYWTGVGSGTATATVATLEPPTAVSASATQSSVAISWTGADAPDGGAVDGYTVLRHGGATAATACAAPGTATTCTDTAVPDGTYTYTVTTVFRTWTAESAPSAPVTVIAVVAPPSAPDLTASSDTGLSSTDDLTNDTTPTFAVIAEPNAMVTLYEGSTPIATANSATDTYELTPSLTDGSHTITAVAARGAVTSNPGPALTITIDTLAPAAGTPSKPDLVDASDSGAKNNDDLTSITTPTFAGTHTGASSSTAPAVAIFDGATQIGAALKVGTSYTVPTTLVAVDGAHNITARAVDLAGNVSGLTSPTLVVTLDTAAPLATVVLANGPGAATAGTADKSDTVTISFSEKLIPKSICDAWTPQEKSESFSVVPSITDNPVDPNDDVLTIAIANDNCKNGAPLNFGTVHLGGNYVDAGAPLVYAQGGGMDSSFKYDDSSRTLTVTFGTRTSGIARTGVALGTPRYTPNPAITDRAGNSIGTTTFTGTISSL